REWPCRGGGQRWAERDRVLHAGIRHAGEVVRALGTSAWLLAGRWIGEVGALARRNPVGLDRRRRRNVIVETAVLVVDEEEHAVPPVGPVAQRVHHIGDEGLPALDVGGRVLVVLCDCAEQA